MKDIFPVHRTTFVRASLAALLLLPGLACAHPGHGAGILDTGPGAGLLSGFAHPFLGLDHVLAAVAVGIWAIRLGGRATWALPAAFVVATAAGAALGFAGIAVPATELGIAVSVLLLGALVALDARFGIGAAVLLAAAFAPWHGAAHALEASSGAASLAYATGFLAATGLLHASGILTGLALRARPLLLRALAAPIAGTGLALLLARI